MAEILLSTAAIWSQRKIEFAQQIVTPASAFVDMTYNAGYSGIEHHPLTGFTSLGRAINHEEFPDFVRAMHQSFRSERNFIDVARHMSPSIALAAFAIYQERIASLYWIEEYQKRIGRKLPVVAYLPHSDKEISPTQFPFGEITVQPTKAEMAKIGSETLEDFMRDSKIAGWTSFVPDLTHLQSIGPWQEVLPQILDDSNEIHISLGRRDAQHEDPQTMQKLDDLYNGRKKTEVFDMLRIIKRHFKGARLVDEIPDSSLSMLRKKNRDRQGLETKAQDRRRIVDQLQEELL